MNLNNESVETLQIIYNKIHKNANDLIEDGIILLENEKYSRSYLCFQIALEELAKLPMINSVAFKVFNKEKVDWKTLNKRLRDHHKKNRQSILMAHSLSPQFINLYMDKELHTLTVEDIKNAFNTFKGSITEKIEIFLIQQFLTLKKSFNESDEILHLADQRNTKKNHSLYADFYENNFQTPNEIITEEDTKELMIEVLIQQLIIEIPNIHVSGFKLKKVEEIERNKGSIEELALKNIRFMENFVQHQTKKK